MAEQEERMTEEQMRAAEEMKRKIMNRVLTKEAIERLGRIRVVKPELASQIELYLVQLYQAGKISSSISEDQLKMILEGISSAKRGFKFIR